MQGYAGTEQQQRLQRVAEEAADWMRDTPGACNAGRIIGTDDPDTLGWDVVQGLLEDHGVLAFRMVPVKSIPAIEKRLAAAGCMISFWDIFETTAAVARQFSGTIILPGVPDGFEVMRSFADDEMAELMALQHACGVVPFSAGFQQGRHGPVATVALRDAESGQIAAGAHAYLPHNRHSRHKGNAWVGLVAVGERFRGRGLGKWVNAAAVVGAVEELGAVKVHELVSADNKASRRMVRAAGPRLVSDRKCGIATRGTGPYTA